MNSQQMKSVIEGLLFASGDEGLELKQLTEVLDLDEESVRALVDDLKGDYRKSKRGLQIVELAGAYQMTTLPAHAPYFERLAHTPSRSSLSQAALETLAIVAYKQPITRIEIEEIRGVKAERALHTLVAKELIKEVDRADAPGRPILYGTTKPFLDYFALGTIAELPESSTFQNDDNLEEETRLLFSRMDQQDQQKVIFEDVTESE